MFRAKLSVFYTSALVGLGSILIGILAGCASTAEDKTLGMKPEEIYNDAKEQMALSQWDKAVPLLEKVEGRAAGSQLAQQAQLDKAYAHYKNSEPAQALATLDRFIKLHPASPALDYALYLKGIVNFNENLGIFSSLTRQDLSERDQKAAKESFAAFKELTTRFPNSRYSEDATYRMRYIVDSLAKYEVHVARYYYKRGAYVAAINRAQTALTDYRDVPALEEALFIIYKSYDALELPKLRDDAKRVLDLNYPQSTFLNEEGHKGDQPWWKFW